MIFDAEGNWFGGTYQGAVCATEFMYGTYALGGGMFTITTGYGMGPQCDPSAAAGSAITFNGDCTTASLRDLTDNCTGARLYLMDGTTMTKRP